MSPDTSFLTRFRYPVFAALAVILAFTLYRTFLSDTRPVGKAYFSTDDGATWFADSYRRPPFTSGGQSAVQAAVFVFPDQKPFVAYLMRYTTAAAAPPTPAAGPIDTARLIGLEVKRPGEPTWTPALDPANPNSPSPAYVRITTVVDRAGRFPMPMLP